MEPKDEANLDLLDCSGDHIGIHLLLRGSEMVGSWFLPGAPIIDHFRMNPAFCPPAFPRKSMQWRLKRYRKESPSMGKQGHRKWAPVPGPCRCGRAL